MTTRSFKIAKKKHFIQNNTRPRYDSTELFMKKETKMKGRNILKTTHQQIGYDLGTSREVISRLLKKMEHEGLVKMRQGEVEVL